MGIGVFTEVTAYTDINRVKEINIGIGGPAGLNIHPEGAVLHCVFVSDKVEYILSVFFAGAHNVALDNYSGLVSLLNLAKLSGKFGIFILELGSLRSGKAPGNGVDFVKLHLEFSQVIFFSGNFIGLGKSCDLSSKLINDILELLFFFYDKSVKFLCALNLGLLLCRSKHCMFPWQRQEP